MTRLFRIGLLTVAVASASAVFAGDTKTISAPTQITGEERVALIRGLQSEFVIVRRTFPMGEKGLALKDGKLSPDDQRIRQMVADHGVAAHPGDRGQITNIEIKDKSIVFELNGGPVKKLKWYQRISVAGMGGETPIAPPPQGVAHGSLLTLEFDKKVPNLTVDEVKQLLAPVFDFSAHSAAEAYLKTFPPIVQEAVKDHRVLVGMDRELVNAAKGRPDQKVREKDDKAVSYEEWIYGKPPQAVTFVRFVGDEVVRVEDMAVDGEKTVRTAKEIDLKAARAQLEAREAAAGGAPSQARSPGQPTESAHSVDPNDPTQQGPTKPPTLRRPGEEIPSWSPDAQKQKYPEQLPGTSTTPTGTDKPADTPK